MPLSKEQLVEMGKTVAKAEKQLKELEKDTRDAEAAGFDVAGYKTRIAEQKKLLFGIKRVYQPPIPKDK